MCGIRVATSLLAGMDSLSRREGVTRSWMNCPLDKSATSAKPWRSQPFGFALDIDQALCVRRDPHLSDFPRSDCHYSGDRFNHVGGHFDSAPRAEYSTSREYNI